MKTKKRKTTFMVSLLLVLMLVLSACGDNRTTPQASVNEKVTVELSD